MTPEQKELFRWRFAAKYMLKKEFSTCSVADQAAKSVEAADKLVAALERSPECEHDWHDDPPQKTCVKCWETK